MSKSKHPRDMTLEQLHEIQVRQMKTGKQYHDWTMLRTPLTAKVSKGFYDTHRIQWELDAKVGEFLVTSPNQAKVKQLQSDLRELKKTCDACEIMLVAPSQKLKASRSVSMQGFFDVSQYSEHCYALHDVLEGYMHDFRIDLEKVTFNLYDGLIKKPAAFQRHFHLLSDFCKGFGTVVADAQNGNHHPLAAYATVPGHLHHWTELWERRFKDQSKNDFLANNLHERECALMRLKQGYVMKKFQDPMYLHCMLESDLREKRKTFEESLQESMQEPIGRIIPSSTHVFLHSIGVIRKKHYS